MKEKANKENKRGTKRKPENTDDEDNEDDDELITYVESDSICTLGSLLGAQRESLRRTNRPAGPPRAIPLVFFGNVQWWEPGGGGNGGGQR